MPLGAKVNLEVMAIMAYLIYFKALCLTDSLLFYVGHSLQESNPFAEMPLAYFTAPADKVDTIF